MLALKVRKGPKKEGKKKVLALKVRKGPMKEKRKKTC
jgi:hypothetical protein